MVTKAEVRAVALGSWSFPPTGVLWDVGAGSGSVAIECALLCPALRVFAVERRPDDAGRIEDNAGGLGAAVTVVAGAAPDALVELPDPDRVFVGGGGLDVLDAVLARLRPGGRVVATYAAIDRAAAAADRLGHLVQVAANRGEQLPDGGWRLAAANPVFVVWGPHRHVSESLSVSVTERGRALAERLPWEHLHGGRPRPCAARWARSTGWCCSWPPAPRCGSSRPLLADKRPDPAVVCVDEAGRFAVALCGGHAGGANDLARPWPPTSGRRGRHHHRHRRRRRRRPRPAARLRRRGRRRRR